MTSVKSARLSGLMLIMLKVSEPHSMSHRLTFNASVEINVCPSLFCDIESMWQVPCAFLNSRLQVAVITRLVLPAAGIVPDGKPVDGGSRTALGLIFQNLTVVSVE
jgi:hypothetical protein